MSLDFSFLESPIPKERQEEIIALLWGPSQRYREQYFHAYFEYYTEQCRCIYLCYGDELSVRKHQHIIDVAERIRKGGSRSEIKDFIHNSEWASGATSDKGVYASIDLTARLIGMVDVGEFENAYTGRPKLLWTEGSFADFMQETFSDSIFLESEGLKLNGGFIMVNMLRIAGFKLEPTSNLCNHLRLRDADQTIEFFHHSSFLMASRHDPTFPPGLIEETISTLALLFPKGDKETQRWHRKQNGPEEIDQTLLQCGDARRHIKEYKYWHDRLVILKTDFDDSRPSNISQWWNDRRDANQWYSLWMAVCLAIFFGLVQSIEGALQVYKAYHP